MSNSRPVYRKKFVSEPVELVVFPNESYTVAETCLAAIGDVSRFPSGKKLAAYPR